MVELLVVIGIISLLLSITFLTINKARAIAKKTVCKAHLHNIGLAFRMYLADSRDIMPEASQLPSKELNDLPRICDVLKPYLGDTKVLKCVADTSQGRDCGKTYFETEGSQVMNIILCSAIKKLRRHFWQGDMAQRRSM